MKFIQLRTSDARLIELDVRGDDRGSFTRTWCTETFLENGVDFRPIQGNSSLTSGNAETIRGCDFQRAPKEDAKIVRCTAGRIHDVIVDLRLASPTRGHIFANELTLTSATMLYIPAGFAHGFQTLADNSVVEYLMGVEYIEGLSDGFRHDDPSIGIQWPEPVTFALRLKIGRGRPLQICRIERKSDDRPPVGADVRKTCRN